MALQKNIETVHGVDINNAYHRVDNIVINNKNQLTFLLNIYADKNFTPVAVESYACEYDLNKENPLKQAYEHLKTLPEFAGAQDC